MHGTMNIKFWN